MPYVEQDLHTITEHLKSPQVFFLLGFGLNVAQPFFYVVFLVLLFLYWSFSFLNMALPVYCRHMSLNVPLLSFSFKVTICLWVARKVVIFQFDPVGDRIKLPYSNQLCYG